LLDRIDLHVQVCRIPPGDLLTPSNTNEPSAVVQERVSQCRERQQQRQGIPNAQLPPDKLASVCLLGEQEKTALEAAARQMHLSGRGLHRTLRVARTIADLETSERIGMAHISEALAYRG
jgi:magnesium chelatase family protein